VNFTGLDNLSNINEYLWISNSYSLQNLSGLENLTSIGDYLYIAYNTVLDDLSALNNLTGIGGSTITLNGNSALTMCNEDDIANACGISCLPNVELNTQAEVNNFATNYSGCPPIINLTIEGADITDLSPLSVITRPAFQDLII